MITGAKVLTRCDRVPGAITSVNEGARLADLSGPSALSRALERWIGHGPGRRGLR